MIDKELIPLGEIAARTPNSFVDGPFGSEMKSDEYTETGVRLIQLQNIGDGAWIDDNQKFISADKFAALKRHGGRPGRYGYRQDGRSRGSSLCASSHC